MRRSDLVSARLDRVIPAALFTAFLALRLPLRSGFLVNWDAVNYALGLEVIDLEHHQPHPPGYLGFILLGRAARLVTGDANAALTVVSVIAGAAIPALFYLLARRVLRRPFAVGGAILLGSSPVVWYYSVVALSYAVGGALVLAVVYAAHRARTDASRGWLIGAAVALSALGAVRQIDMALLLPVVIWAAVPFEHRTRIRGAVALVLTSLLWGIPLLLLAGGIGAYLDYATGLATFAGGRTWLGSFDPVGMAQNFGLVALGLVVGLNVLLLPWAASTLGGQRPFRRLDAATRQLVLLWTVPALLVFLLVHTGQVGYVLVILPAGVLVATAAAQALVDERATETLLRRAFPRRRTTVVAGALAVNLIGFFVLPPVGHTVLSARDTQATDTDPQATFIQDRTRQFDLRRNDEHWADLIATVERFDPDKAVVLGVPTSGGSFRHLTYYAPDHLVLGLGFDRGGRFGALATARDRTSDYSIDSIGAARPEISLPAGTRYVLVPDREVAVGLRWEALRPVKVHDRIVLYALAVPDGVRLVFHQAREWSPPFIELVRPGAERFDRRTPVPVGHA
ncbi:MAG: DUF2723 domain-containing protein [Actinobacteria bacterium]|nr:DUF2723 domain-containing protein [Actinomycetota bacterium]